MRKRDDDFYQKLRKRMRKWLEGKGRGHAYADYLLFAPDLFHLLAKLSLDRRVPAAQRAKVLAALAYFVSPIDLIPEALVGPLGFADDIAVAAHVLNGLVNAGHGDLAREHWAGEDDVLDVIQYILEVADELVGSGLWKRLKHMFGAG